MIPVPNLDDRTWKEFVDEAIRLIPKYCPEWTNHNPSDPGITLIELFAWLMEMSIYRLNKVTDKNFLAFLDLMGIEQQPPQPAVALLTFDLVAGARNLQIVPEGTTVATDSKGDDPPLIFETKRDLVVIPNKLTKCYSQFHDNFDDVTDRIGGRPGRSFEAFMGCQRIERLLYISDPNFETISEEAVIILGVSTPESPDTHFPILCEWEFWNGHRWRDLNRASMELPHGYVAFEGTDEFEQCEINEEEGFWIRGRLVEVPDAPETTIADKIFVRIEVLGDGVEPDELLIQIEDDLLVSPDTSKNFHLFHKTPKTDYTLYLSSPELFGHAHARIRIECELADASISDPANPSDDLQIQWEYYDGKRWQKLGISGPKGIEDSTEGVELDDTTGCFKRNGTISFNIPENISDVDFNGTEGPWIRARINKGCFGEQGTYELEGDRWIWKEDNPLRPPVLQSLRLKYSEADRVPSKLITYNDFRYNDISDTVKSDFGHAQIFEPIAEESPSIYLGFGGPFPNQQILIYFHVVEKTSLDLDREHEERLKEYYKKMEEMYYGDKKLVWEYFNGSKWVDLGVADHTRAFTESGFVEFLGPKDMSPSQQFSEFLFWIRCRLEMGGYEQLPNIDHVLLNSVEAEHRTTLKFEIMGSGQGTPSETVHFMNKPVLEGEEIWVREKENPQQDELDLIRAELGDGSSVLKNVPGEESEKWVRWTRIDSFYASGPRSRHYSIDRISGEVRFGDGRHGMLVPKGDQNIRCELYRVGGGAKGNVGPGMVSVQRQAIAYIDGVTNHYTAQGGSDVESVEELKQRGPHVIKSRYRAVTKEDFEWLTMQSSASIARTHCLPSSEREGEVAVLIVPKFNEENPDYSEKLLASTELLRRVKAYLDERRLITVKINVERPNYREISVALDVIRSPRGSGERLKRDIEQALRKFLHPIHGARDGKGWAFGRNVLKVDLYHISEEVEGVDFVDSIQIFDEDRRTHVEQVKLDVRDLPYLVNVDITEKARERIL